MHIDIGKIIAGKYELVRLLGQGAMGEVWLAKHKTLGGEFAIKLADPSELHGDAEGGVAARFQLEAQLSAKFARKTRHVVSVSDHGEEAGIAYLVMELLDGEGLDARLVRTGPLPLLEVSVIVGQIARALAVAHAEETFHRDLKPANVFLTRDEDGRLLVKVFDFGIARTRRPMDANSPISTTKNMVLGTPSYMSPEQARGLKTLDHRCDVWALAVLAYEALTGAVPWEGETVEEVFLAVCTFRATPILTRNPYLPPALAGIFEKAFAPKLGDRFATAIEFARALHELCEPEALSAMGVREGTLNGLPSEASLPSLDRASGDLPSVPSGVEIGETAAHERHQLRKRKKLVALVPLLLLTVVVGVGIAGLLLSRGAHTDAATAQASQPPVHAAGSVAPESQPTVPPPDPMPTSDPVVAAPEPRARSLPEAPATNGKAPRPDVPGISRSTSSGGAAPSPAVATTLSVPQVRSADTSAPARPSKVEPHPAPVGSAAPRKTPDRSDIF